MPTQPFQRIKYNLQGARETVKNVSGIVKNKRKTNKAIASGVKRAIKKKYPAGLGSSAGSMEIKNKIKKDFIKRVKKY